MWKKDFLKSAQSYWHGKFWLVNNFPKLEFEHKSKRYRPNIWCKFKLLGGDADKDVRHHVIDVVRLHRTESWFGSHSKLYDNLDTNSVQKGTDSGSKAIMQRARVHEVGHLIGLGHVDIGKAHCPPRGNTNASACYGVADDDKRSVMGQGMELRYDHAMPWRKAAIQLLGVGLAATRTDWEPKRIQHYPRLPAEVLTKAAITAKPKR